MGQQTNRPDAASRWVHARPDLTAGVYYAFVSTKYCSGHLLWNVRVELKPGGHTLTLNERNAMALE